MSEMFLDNSNFHTKIKDSNLPVMVDFYADWCGPCKMMSPVLEQLAEEYNGKVNVYKLNVDEAREIAGEFGINSIPTVIIFKDGQKVDQFIGALPKSQIEGYIKKYV